MSANEELTDQDARLSRKRPYLETHLAAEKDSSFRRKLNEFRKDGLWTDVVIAIPGQPDIKAHKNVLAAASSFFQAMFQVHTFVIKTY